MDMITKLGPLALASRLRRLSERLSKDASRIYQDHQLEFEAPWFPVMYLLKQQSPMSVTSIARALGITHPAVNQLAAAMTRRGLLVAAKDADDERRRLLSLSAKARRMLEALEPIWGEIKAATGELVEHTGLDVLGALTVIERELDKRPMYDRVAARLAQRQYDAVEIVEYRPGYKKFFRDLNYEWLTKYFSVEPIDEKVLNDPQGQVLKQGGFIFFARVAGDIVGTVALLKINGHTFELAKMAVTEHAQGRRAGRRLADAAIARAKEKGADAVILHTSPELVAAVNLYRKLGFVPVPADPGIAQYSRCTITMRLDLTKNRAIT